MNQATEQPGRQATPKRLPFGRIRPISARSVIHWFCWNPAVWNGKLNPISLDFTTDENTASWTDDKFQVLPSHVRSAVCLFEGLR